jgi:hypothetical protein
MISPNWAKEHVVKRSPFTDDPIALALKTPPRRREMVSDVLTNSCIAHHLA